MTKKVFLHSIDIFSQADGNYAMPIVGEVYRQDALEAICSNQVGSKKVMASLILEDENPHDSNSVRVEINDRKVGYLSRSMAKLYREILVKEGYSDIVGLCEAVVVSPHNRETPPSKLLEFYYKGDIYNVFLDLFNDAIMDVILKELGKRAVQVTFDSVRQVKFAGSRFCLTGGFDGSQDDIKMAIESRGGTVAGNVSKRLQYLVVGNAGSPEWKHGAFGTKIEKAMLIKEEDGAAISIISEEQLIEALVETT